MTPDAKNRVVDLLAQLREALDGSEPPDRIKEFLDTTFAVPRTKVTLKEFRKRFLDRLPPDERATWTQQKIGREVRRHRQVKNGTANKLYVHGVSFEPPATLLRERVRYVAFDDSTGFFYVRDDTGRWTRLTDLSSLRKFGVSAADIAAIEKECRANPIDLQHFLNETR